MATIYRVGGTYVDPVRSQRLLKDSLGVYRWVPISEGTELIEEIQNKQLDFEQTFQSVPGGYVRRSTQEDINSKTKDWVTDDIGGFLEAVSPSASNTPFVTSTHAAVRAYPDWVPHTAAERGLRNAIDRIESRARHEESEHSFLGVR